MFRLPVALLLRPPTCALPVCLSLFSSEPFLRLSASAVVCLDADFSVGLLAFLVSPFVHLCSYSPVITPFSQVLLFPIIPVYRPPRSFGRTLFCLRNPLDRADVTCSPPSGHVFSPAPTVDPKFEQQFVPFFCDRASSPLLVF